MIHKLVTKEALSEIYDGEIPGIHGAGHWFKVSQLGTLIALTEGVSTTVPMLFGLYHDCRRFNDGQDPEHGKRAAALVADHFARGLLTISSDEFQSLIYACTHHSSGTTTGIPEVACCWDADRLDLPRVGWQTDIDLMSTDTGRTMATSQFGYHEGDL